MTSVRCRYGILTTCLIMLCTLAAAQSIDVTTDNTNPEIGENIEFVIRANAQGVNLNAVAVYLDLTNDFALEGDIFVNESDWTWRFRPALRMANSTWPSRLRAALPYAAVIARSRDS